jgi:hypothetical protein
VALLKPDTMAPPVFTRRGRRQHRVGPLSVTRWLRDELGPRPGWSLSV